ncbi:MAG: citrate synthase family protein [Candidatus Promineifilaceae bacterium]|nr:citrate synthase family protein [Candidatus Promineifilaceae bacterium]
MKEKQYLMAEEAAERLGVSRATLYAYVSRGLVRSEPAAKGSRRHRYRAEDVRRLQRRKEQRLDPEAAAQDALHFGAPVLESAITLIDDGRLYYRGRDVLGLAQERSAEEVAGLIWTGNLDAGPLTQVERPPVPHVARPDLSVVERFQVVLPLAAAGDLAAFDLRSPAVVSAAGRILWLLVQAAGSGEGMAGDGLVEVLRHSWSLPDDAVPLLNAALILCADHELNVSSFTARCVASAGGTPYGVVQAGLAALRGSRHGGHTERVEALLREVGEPEQAPTALAARLQRGEPVPGFGHRLYPDGDPRGRLLLEMARGRRPRSPAVALATAVAAAAKDLLGQRPTVDFGLVAAAGALGLPSGSALALFAIGRTIGWIGHALEQIEAGTMIRPRARYVGRLP